MFKKFQNRIDAGRQLALSLMAYKDRSDVVVLALPRGGVPVAFEIAKALNAPLDLFIVRKLGVPDQSELAMGAIATGGVLVLNDYVVKSLQIPVQKIKEVVMEEHRELERREKLYRGNRPTPNLQNKVVLLVDDGIATGSTMRAAIKGLKLHSPACIVVATPTAPPPVCRQLQAEVDEVVCLITPEPFSAVGFWYEDFSQTTDDEVRALLKEAASGQQNIAYLDAIAAQLQSEKEKLHNSASYARSLPTDELTDGWQERDSAAERELRDIEYSKLSAMQLRLRQLDEAQERLKAGTYGLCTECGKEINPKRLALDPAVALCVSCQSSFEKEALKHNHFATV
ncbi:MAG: TraR/DksA C4-type zinc finger protein [Blastocatellia bacterium]|nr:TraR/DksA C4-type zinc finger protein [Blastocatellia bacterium]